ncbi:secreted hydrolase [Minicystis rosea]|nr:secreted hydrolase [Minicystis rosea]
MRHPSFTLFASLGTLMIVAACGDGSGSGTSTGGGTSAGGGTTGSASSASASSSASSASSSTGGGMGGSAGTDCKSLPLCDDFEGATAGGPPDPTKWSVVSPDCSGTGTLTIDASVAHSGASSVKVSGKGGYCNHVFFANTSAIGALGKKVYGRFFLRLSDALGDGHVTFLAMKDTNDGGKSLRMGGQGKAMMWNRESDDATLPAISPAGLAQSVQPTPSQWYCVEFLVDGELGHIQTWVDGQDVPGLHEDGTPTPDIDQQWLTKPGYQPSLTDYRLGWESYAGQDMTLWFDDVALAAQRIGCN